MKMFDNLRHNNKKKRKKTKTTLRVSKWMDSMRNVHGNCAGGLSDPGFARVRFDNEGENRNREWNLPCVELKIEIQLPRTFV